MCKRRNFSTWLIFSIFFIARVEKLLHVTDILHIFHCSCHVETFLHDRFLYIFPLITYFAPHLSWGELSICDRFSSHFSCGETSPHDNLSHGNNSPHDRFFSTSTACGACEKYQVWKYYWSTNYCLFNHGPIKRAFQYCSFGTFQIHTPLPNIL